MKCICFSNQREINTWSSGDNTRHEKISQQTMLSPIALKTLFILALSVLCPFSTTHRFLCGNVVLKLVQCVCECFLLCTVWSCWVQNIHHSFVGWTRIELSCPHLPFVIRTASASAPCRTGGSPQRPDGFPGKSAWGETPLHHAARCSHVAAAELLLSKGAAVDAKENDGRGLNPRSVRQTSSLELGAFQFYFSLKFWEPCLHLQQNLNMRKISKNVGINDHMYVAIAGASKAEAGPEIESLQLGALQESLWDGNSVLQHC